MRTIGILMLILTIGTTASVASESPCQYSKDTKGYLLAFCRSNDKTTIRTVPQDLETDIQVLDLSFNAIGRLANDSFARYPGLKKLWLVSNKVHTVEPGALSRLAELESLDLSDNALKSVPAGLPRSLRKLYLDLNPMAADMGELAAADGLESLHVRSDGGQVNEGLRAYPAFGAAAPALVELDVSLNQLIADVTPAQLAATCRLARLNVTGCAALFRRADQHCACRRFARWTADNRIAVAGLASAAQCPDPPADGDGAEDPTGELCDRVPDEAVAVFNDCKRTWERRNVPYAAVGAGLVILVAVVWLLLCVRARRSRRRRRDRARADGNGNGNGNGKPVPPAPAAVDRGAVKVDDGLQTMAAETA